MTTRRLLWRLIAASTLARTVLALCLGLGNDEAYHYLYTVHRDWSYFDHPPMVAWVAEAGLLLSGGGPSPTALRIGFVAMFAGSTWLTAALTSRFFGEKAGLFAAIALNLAGYYAIAAGTFALADGPLVFFWLLTLYALASAIKSPDRVAPWLGVGVAWGGALLSKYHAVLLPAGFLLYLVLEPPARRWLRRPGPYLAFAIGVLLFSPVLWWNARHGWASFAFQGGRALGSSGFQPAALVTAIVGPALYLFPWIWIGLILVGGSAIGRMFRGEAEPGDRFLLSQAALPIVGFTAIACVRPVLPHWSLVGFLSLLPLLGRSWLSRSDRNHDGMTRRLALMAGLLISLAGLAAVQARWGVLQAGGRGRLGLLAVSEDPSVDLFGWDQIAEELERRGLSGRPDSFLFTTNWYYSGQLAFAAGPGAEVLCYNSRDSRGFAFWSRPEDCVGRDGILVSINDRVTEPQVFDRWFTRIEPIGRFDVMRAGRPVRKVRLFRCVSQTRPFPFDATAHGGRGEVGRY